MTRRQLIQRMKGVLLRRRDALWRSLSGELEQLSPSDQRGVGDSVDAAVDTDYREINSGLVEAESRELIHIERALDRMRQGRYGICEGCGDKIPGTRLKALPYATMCVGCQRLREQGDTAQEPTQDWPRVRKTPGRPDDPAVHNVSHFSG